jgi:hypothetical protein
MKNFAPTKVNPNIPIANVAYHGDVMPIGMWYLDSRSTHHVTNDVNHLTIATPYNGIDALMAWNGNALLITQTRATSILMENGTTILNDVLVVPNITKNLLSIYHFCQDNPLNVEFDNYGFSIKDQQI